MKKKLLSIAAGLGLLLGSFVTPASAHHNSDIAHCSGFITVELFTGWNYDMTGSQYYKKFCATYDGVINVPNLGAYVGMNNSVSSLKIHNAGSSTTGRRVQFYFGTSYGTIGLTIRGSKNEPNLGVYANGINNAISSFRTLPN